MAWELTIRGGKVTTLAAWSTRLRSLGATLEPHPSFMLHATAEAMPFALTILPTSRLYAPRLAEQIAVLMQFETEVFGPLDRRLEGNAIAFALDQRIARLTELGAPPIVLEHERSKRESFERPSEQRICVSVPDSQKQVQALAATAYALASGAQISCFEGSFEGDAILGWMATCLLEPFEPTPFRGW